MRLRDRASAQVSFSPARWVTMNWTPCRAAQAAASLRKEPNGSAVLQSLSKPASVSALSEADGKVNAAQESQSMRCIAVPCLAVAATTHTILFREPIAMRGSYKPTADAKGFRR